MRRRQQTDTAKANPQGSRNGRLPGLSREEVSAVGKTIRRWLRRAIRESQFAVHPSEHRTDGVKLDQLIAKAKSQKECYITAEPVVGLVADVERNLAPAMRRNFPWLRKKSKRRHYYMLGGD